MNLQKMLPGSGSASSPPLGQTPNNNPSVTNVVGSSGFPFLQPSPGQWRRVTLQLTEKAADGRLNTFFLHIKEVNKTQLRFPVSVTWSELLILECAGAG